MRSLTEIVKVTEKLAIDNSPALLTAVGVVGTISTAVFAARGALRYDEAVNIEIEYRRQNDPSFVSVLDPRTRVMLMGHHFGPAIIVGSLTVTAIIGANRIGTRRAAAMAAAYTIAQEGFDEYKYKVREKIGENKERALRDDIAQDRVNRNPAGESNVIIVGSGDVLCYEMMNDRYFQSSVEEIKKAMNDTNYQVNNDSYASLSDFYDRVGLPHTSVSDSIGWRSDEKLLEIEFSTVLAPDGRPCVAFDFRVDPVRNYHKLH